MMFLFFVLAFFYFEHVSKQNSLQKLKDNFPTVTAEDAARVNKYKEIDTNKLNIGFYQGEATKDNVYLKYTFYFMDNGEVIKEFFGKRGSRELELRGTAKYEIVGSVIKYDYISGDKGLFSQAGEVIEVVDDDNIIIIDENEYHLKRKDI
jgi:hypothetical protein